MRGGEVVSCEAHNLETRAHIPAPQQVYAGVAQWLEQNLHKVEVVGFESHHRHMEGT